MEIRVGTSGYSFEDWRGPFYPVDVEKGKMLDHYFKFFSTVEINSTYYRIPHPAVMHNIAKKASKGCDFMVKVPQSFTHRRSDLESDINAFREAIKPMEDTGKLSGLLAQFPYSFKFSPDALDYISLCREAVAPHDLFTEFRHNGWVNPATLDRLRTEKIGFVSVDEPALPGLLKPEAVATSDTAYVRLHGRNKEHWWQGGALRYDYSYSPEELEEWRRRIDKLKGQVKKAYVFFNNCHLGQAARNALDFQGTATLS
jgi:uncharacterized protein YecE (DUF72 family)